MKIFYTIKNGIKFLVILITSILFFSCKTDALKKQTKETAQTINIDYNRKETNINSVKSIDTTTYILNCFNSTITNGKDVFNGIENILLQRNILTNTTSEAYRSLFLNY